MPLIQSAMALRTVSIQSPSLAEVVDEGLEKVQEKNNVGQKLHKTPPFVDGWIKKRLGARAINKPANRRGLSVSAQAAVWNNRLRSRWKQKCRLLLAIGNGNNIYISFSQGSRPISSHVTP